MVVKPALSAHSLPGSDDITRVELPNGIVVLTRQNVNSPSISISGYLTVGSLADPDDKLGLADFTATAIMRGTAQSTFQEIYDALESVGATLGFNSGTHTTGFGGRALAEDLDLVLKLLASALRWPVFPAEQVERLRAQLLTSLAIRSQDTADMAALTFDQVCYAGHPYSRPEDGYPETVQAIRRSDLESFHRQQYGPTGLVIAVVGAVEAQRAADRVAHFLGDWQNPAQVAPSELPPLAPILERRMGSATLPGKSQADIVIGAPGPLRRSDDYIPATLANSILGQFGLMGRIGEAVRERAGLAYHASSSLGSGIGPGPWRVTAGIDPENVEKAIALILQEIERFAQEPVYPEELADSQAHFIGRLPLSLESNAGVAGAILILERFDLGLDYYQRYPDLIRAVTIDEVKDVAHRYLEPDHLCIATAGPPRPA